VGQLQLPARDPVEHQPEEAGGQDHTDRHQNPAPSGNEDTT
jgi:hypothetical protein